jgi:hypothetical protein
MLATATPARAHIATFLLLKLVAALAFVLLHVAAGLAVFSAPPVIATLKR